MKTHFARTVLFTVRALAASMACVGLAAASPPPIASSEAFEDALDLYSQGKWSAAYRRFAGLADEGDADAAKVALLMVRYGTRLYGHECKATQPQIDHWIAISHQRMKVLNVSADE